MRKFLLTLLIVASAIAAKALDVQSQAGMLASMVEDKTITELTITGEMDARDFQFISEELTELVTLDLSGVRILAYEGTLPDKRFVNGYAADAIPMAAFFGSTVTTLSLPEGLKAIEQAAFAGCENLTAITIPSSVEVIGDYAFNASGLTSITIPQTCVTVGKGAFARCESMQEAVINASDIGIAAFLGDIALTTVTIGNSVTAIGDAAFSGCAALSAFIVAPESQLESVGNEAFLETAVESLDLSNASALATIGDWAFAQVGSQAVTLPDAVNSLGQGTFFMAPELTDVNLPTEVTAVPDYFLAGSNKAAADTLLHQAITAVGDYAFYNNDQLTDFVVPASVKQIGSWAMAGTTGLRSVIAHPVTVPALGDSVWAGVNQPEVNLDVTAGNDIADLYAAANQWKEFHILRDYLMGDVNDDGMVDARDVTTMINFILGNNPNPFVFGNGDFDFDEEINGKDVTSLINVILSGAQTTVRRARATGSASGVFSTDDRVTLSDVSLRPGARTTVEVALHNTQPYIAMQADIVLPEGISIVDGTLAMRGRAHGHGVLSRWHGESNTLSIMAFSMMNARINNGKEVIMQFDVEADERMSGEAIEMRDIAFVNVENDLYVLNDALAQISNVTGVNDVAAANGLRVYTKPGTIVVVADAAAKAQLVAANGAYREVRLNVGENVFSDIAQGIYIIRVNGKSHKVIVK